MDLFAPFSGTVLGPDTWWERLLTDGGTQLIGAALAVLVGLLLFDASRLRGTREDRSADETPSTPAIPPSTPMNVVATASPDRPRIDSLVATDERVVLPSTSPPQQPRQSQGCAALTLVALLAVAAFFIARSTFFAGLGYPGELAADPITGSADGTFQVVLKLHSLSNDPHSSSLLVYAIVPYGDRKGVYAVDELGYITRQSDTLYVGTLSLRNRLPGTYDIFVGVDTTRDAQLGRGTLTITR